MNKKTKLRRRRLQQPRTRSRKRTRTRQRPRTRKGARSRSMKGGGGGDGMFEWNNKIRQHVKYFIDAKTTTSADRAWAWSATLNAEELEKVGDQNYGKFTKLFYIVYTRFKNFIPQHLWKAMNKSENIEEFLKTYYDKIKVDDTKLFKDKRKQFNLSFSVLKGINDFQAGDSIDIFDWDIGINFIKELKVITDTTNTQIMVYPFNALDKTQIMPTLEHLTLYLMNNSVIQEKLKSIKEFTKQKGRSIRSLGRKQIKQTQSFASEFFDEKFIQLLTPDNLSISITATDLRHSRNEWNGFRDILIKLNAEGGLTAKNWPTEEVLPTQYLTQIYTDPKGGPEANSNISIDTIINRIKLFYEKSAAGSASAVKAPAPAAGSAAAAAVTAVPAVLAVQEPESESASASASEALGSGAVSASDAPASEAPVLGAGTAPLLGLGDSLELLPRLSAEADKLNDKVKELEAQIKILETALANVTDDQQIAEEGKAAAAANAAAIAALQARLAAIEGANLTVSDAKA
jgi:hypothetical protein